MKKTFYSAALLGAALLLGTGSCTNLEDKVLGAVSTDKIATGGVGTVDPAASLVGVYSSLNGFTDQGNTYAMQEHTSDEQQGPTRGTDWGDFGVWRKLHQHTWDAAHGQVTSNWDFLNSGVFKATQTISFAGSNNQIKAEASFLRAFFTYNLVDLYGQVPSREVTDDAEANPKVLSRAQATENIITDLNFAIANLGTTARPGIASKQAAQFLLAKVLLNKAVYTADPTKPAGPFTFTPADMTQVVTLVNAITASAKYALEPKGEYFDNFHWENLARSKELIFTIDNPDGNQSRSVRNRYYMTSHYNQGVSGWNGFTTLADFYNSFEKTDERLGGPLPGLTDKLGMNAGFLVGQQLDAAGKPLKDRSGNPLIFTPDVDLLFATEAKGIRVIKYLPQPGSIDNPTTSYVFFRYADALLMKAEALLRGGTDATGQTAAAIVNDLRAKRGVAALPTVTEANLLAERGRELYWEGHRRTDQVRFGTFLNPMDNKASKSPDFRVLFPIPQRAIDTNPNLKQNFGY